MRTIRIPKTFYWDHKDRDLPSPQIDYETKTHIYIFADEALQDLVDDAKFYADKDATDAPYAIKLGARTLLNHLARGGVAV